MSRVSSDSMGSSSVMALLGGGGGSNSGSLVLNSYIIPGSHKFRAPVGVTRVLVGVVSGGANGTAEGGGGGGACVSAIVGVTPGKEYNITVGNTSGTSSFDTLITCTGASGRIGGKYSIAESDNISTIFAINGGDGAPIATGGGGRGGGGIGEYGKVDGYGGGISYNNSLGNGLPHGSIKMNQSELTFIPKDNDIFYFLTNRLCDPANIPHYTNEEKVQYNFGSSYKSECKLSRSGFGSGGTMVGNTPEHFRNGGIGGGGSMSVSSIYGKGGYGAVFVYYSI